jgi:hypothetical protein
MTRDSSSWALLELGRAIVQKYLPEAESKTLLARLDGATERTAALLGLEEKTAPRGEAGGDAGGEHWRHDHRID